MNNSATNFRECVAENLQQVFFGQGHFEELVTWYDNDGATGREITVSDVTAAGEMKVESHHQATGRSVQFLVTNDGTLGTTTPARGNRIVRADGTKWGFARVVSSDQFAFILEFVGGQIDRAGYGKAGGL